jgi:hypothetical protein
MLLSSKDSKSFLQASLSSPAFTEGERINNLFLTSFKIGFLSTIVFKI